MIIQRIIQLLHMNNLTQIPHRIVSSGQTGVDLAALKSDPGFAKGLNTYNGVIIYRPVADALGYGNLYKSQTG
jgi:alanine dehydrogenase